MTQHPTLTTHTEGHLRVLQALDGAGHVSQRTLADAVGLAASQVNRIIHSLLDAGHLRVADDTVRPYAYELTPEGQARLRRLSYERYADVVDDYRRVKARIRDRLARLAADGIERVAFYGAGEIMGVALPLARELGLEVVTVVDDDPARQGARGGSVDVASPGSLAGAGADAVVITSFRHADAIRQKIRPDLLNNARVVEL